MGSATAAESVAIVSLDGGTAASDTPFWNYTSISLAASGGEEDEGHGNDGLEEFAVSGVTDCADHNHLYLNRLVNLTKLLNSCLCAGRFKELNCQEYTLIKDRLSLKR